MSWKIAIPLVLLLSPPVFGAGTLQNSKHNLSVTGTGTAHAASESQTCIFCHTPHNASPAVPLWNHASSVASYTIYASTTLKVTATIGQPTGSSKLCLSCHDGTVALGQTVNDGSITMVGAGPGGRMPAGSSNLGTSLLDDHPVSFQRNPADGETIDPPPGDPVRLDGLGQVQCTSCHDPHSEDADPVTRKFLVKSNQRSQVCVTCHRPAYWDANPSVHRNSSAVYTAAQGAHTGYVTVRDNGCESCHRPHTGGAPERLLKFVEELTCDRCHNGTVVPKNIASAFTKLYVHPTYRTTPSAHDASEGPTNPSHPLPEIAPGAPRHAECADCHNPHAAYAAGANAPNVPGELSGVWGIDSAGARVAPALYEYQICYKCHGDSANKPQPSTLPDPPYTRRQIVQFNTRLEFDPGNPSHHAVEAAGRSVDVPSLLPPYTTASVIYCSSCHNSDTGPEAGGTGPAGPHGSQYPHILERNLVVGDTGSGSIGTMYALCFKCHAQSSILGDVTFGQHRKHVEGEHASCTVCHDPHGVSLTQGNATNNARLINFDLDVVHPPSGGVLSFDKQAGRHGACYLLCHGKEHNPETY